MTNPVILLYVIYSILVVFPLIILISNKKPRLNSFFFYLSQACIIVLPFILSNIIPILDDSSNNKMVVFCFSAALSIFSVYLNHMINIRNEYNKIRGDLHFEMNKLLENPILKTNEILNDTIDSIFQLNKTKQIALDISTESLKDISSKGFIRINITHSVYTGYLLDVIKKCTNIVGTFTSRPLLIQNDKNPDTVNYLNLLKKKKNIRRICVLEENEIDEICSTKNNSNKYPEIEWFNSNVNSTKIKWCDTNSFVQFLQSEHVADYIIPSGISYMTDFAVFDKELLLMWQENDIKSSCKISETTGTMVMLIGKPIKELYESLDKYLTNQRYGFDSFEEMIES